ncbi:MAG TPA: ABC transporter substrate-binding protein [Flavitalea sp.]|nr:ABC transporter substrate-binding protein [Flavitalea sp.]
MKTATVGLILPTSSILPMSRHFETGLKSALKGLSEEGWEINVVSELVGEGSKKRVAEAMNNLSGHYDADIITGIVSNRVVNALADTLGKSKKTILINNIGEHIPDSRSFNEYTFLHSNHIWKQLWSLNNWAVQTYGRKGMFVASLYDSGYSFMNMMKLGMIAANPESELPFSVACASDGNTLADPREVLKHITEYKPDFVLAAFCGEEASLFLQAYIESGFHKKIPLLSLPFLLESFDAKGEELEIYTTTASYSQIEAGFLNGSGAKLQHPFSDLGYESGLIIAEALKQSNGNDLHEVMKTITANGNNGLFNVNPDFPGRNKKVFLVKNMHTGDKNAIERHIVKELPTIEIDDPEIRITLDEPGSGWDNPYLGI